MLTTPRLLRLSLLATGAACLVACEKPSVVTEADLKFLHDQTKPLFLADVTNRLGPTAIGRDGPYYEYVVAATKTSVEFWMYPPPDPLPDAQGDIIPVEIAMVVKATLGGKKEDSRIIWPNGLGGPEKEAVWKRIWNTP